MIMLGIFVLLPSLIVPSLGLPFLSSRWVHVCTCGAENPSATSIMGFVTLKAFYLPGA